VWLEQIYEKVGNQITISPVGYKVEKVDKIFKLDDWNNSTIEKRATLIMNVTNSGLSDQIHDDIKIQIQSQSLSVIKGDSNSRYEERPT